MIKRHGETIAVVLVFIAILGIGLTVFDDYALAYDDPFERTTTLINLKYIYQKLFPDSPLPLTLAEQPDLDSWEDRTYGVVTQFPTAVVELIFGFPFSLRSVFLMRHLLAFLQVYVGLICFYFLLRARFRSGWLALLGCILLWLSPRMFADSFTNVKDAVFMAWMMIAGLFLVRWMERRKTADWILFSIFASVATNVRVFGGILVLYALFSVVILIRRGEMEFWSGLRTSVWMMFVYGFCWMLWMPYAWENPVRAVRETLGLVSATPVVFLQLYLGKLISNQNLPWHYLPVWVAVTTPILILLGFLIGLVQSAVSFFRSKDEPLCNRLTDGLAFSIVLIPMGMTMILRPPIYNGWRHLYYIYPWMVYFLVVFLNQIRISKRKVLRVLLFSLVGCSLIWNGVWILWEHPYEMVYFNEVTPVKMRMNFEKDYWYMSCRDVIQTVLDRNENLRVVVGVDNEALDIQLQGFAPAEAMRIVPAGVGIDYSELDFYLENMTRLTESTFDFPAFQKVQEIIVDQVPIVNLYQRIRDRFVPGIEVSMEFEGGSSRPQPELSDWNRETVFESRVDNSSVIQLDLRNVTKIYGVSFLTIERKIGIPTDLRILSSLDGVNYETVSLKERSYSEFFFEPVEARYVRIETGATDVKWQISEVQVWEAKE